MSGYYILLSLLNSGDPAALLLIACLFWLAVIGPDP